jgi:hypothetical protein
VFAHEQFSETSDGRIAFALRKPRKNGTTHLFFTPCAPGKQEVDR